MREIFTLEAKYIKDLELKIEGKLPVNRDELLALANSWGRKKNFYTDNKDNKYIRINKCRAKEKYDLSKLDVSEITNFNSIFRYSNFNGDINSWDVSNGTNMDWMFSSTKEFNSPLDNWDVSNVTNMKSMFSFARVFNQPLNKWNILNVITLNNMFAYTEKFNSPLDNWNTSNVVDMTLLFSNSKEFNQNINSWNISNVIYMNCMFEGAKAFNQPILWDLPNIIYCNFMLIGAKAFQNKFNNKILIDNAKEWLIENRLLMEAIHLETNKGKELETFLLNFNVIDSANLNGLHNIENIIKKKD